MKAYFIGGGIGSLAGAAFLIRDAAVPGRDITIYEALSVFGGSLDGAQLPNSAYSLRGGRMLTTDHYECTWDLLSSIPSIERPGVSVRDETVAFNEENRANSRARLVDRNRFKVDVSHMGFSGRDRLELLRLVETSEETLGNSRITDWLSPGFFASNFWYMWQTTFAFQPWHSAVELKRYLHRFMNEFPRIETLAGVKRTVYNQYDAIVRPLTDWLERHGVQFVQDTRVINLSFEPDGEKLRVRQLVLDRDGRTTEVRLEDGDLAFFENGSMTDASSLGSMTEPPTHLTKADSQGWALWEKIAKGRPEFGNPSAFNSSIPESYWLSFTVTCRDTRFFDQMEAFSGNKAGTGGLVTFKDSNWLMSVVLYHQPHFSGQPKNVQVFWGYALHPDRVGNFVAKPMSDCSGAEILNELCGHLNFDRTVFEDAICIPCRMPYITSMFMPRAATDRPLPVPKNSVNLAFVSQFVEIPDDVVFTVEYSVRGAQMAVYQLMKIDRPIPPVTRHDKSLAVLLRTIEKAFA
ncbi:oleate hydratase [Bradyrhizobium diazoefficiens]|nr:oleate hydratase [Bradyrhizobium diazoefficiens]MBR0965600.1 oleate hydratase [Bradyrhizobium diazoefficiens]MBR0979292.1 oleate hydratase [Bradyrhizobium diazoefficiens]MBR1008684.1 oleate hydratase [Bradyrhizobium diazoefficiens]MBR1014767.1 oleate hydratase [Bradyrhizobium diazoefficiens]MBR1052645.1 oleate hydratase [Bradyrhizobium diazoefficiens]